VTENLTTRDPINMPPEPIAEAKPSTRRPSLLRSLGPMLVLLVLVLGLRPGTAFRAFAGRAIQRASRRSRPTEVPRLVWPTADPQAEGLSRPALDTLRAALAQEGTDAFLVVRGGHLVYEWYAPQSGPNHRHGLAAMAKALTGSPVIFTALSDGRVALDDPAAKYIPAWRNDSIRATIRIRDLAAHQSGIDDVDFDNPPNGWKRYYVEHHDERFAMALAKFPVLFPPGSRFSYSGVGYYALAYALAASLKGTPQTDVRSLLRERIMLPLGVPDDDWLISYHESYQLDGMTLYAIGSGASYTARAAARVGQLVLDRGRWGDRRLLDSSVVARSLQPADGKLPPDSGDYRLPPPAMGGGWWLNLRGSWPSVPRDAFAGMGGGDEAILVVPSLDLIMVRMGKDLSAASSQFGVALRDQLFDPLMRAVVGPSSRMRGRSKPEVAPDPASIPPAREEVRLRAPGS
jgi:CubicO group peptidase (beta-lactamase class C family)